MVNKEMNKFDLSYESNTPGGEEEVMDQAGAGEPTEIRGSGKFSLGSLHLS